jgi:hypothetical protein
LCHCEDLFVCFQKIKKGRHTLALDDHVPSTDSQYGGSKRRLDHRTAVNKARGHEWSVRSPLVPLGSAFLAETKTTEKQKPPDIVQKTWRDTTTTGSNREDQKYSIGLKTEKH